MSAQNLSQKAEQELDRLVERVARKSGYSGGGETYREHLQRKFDQKMEKAKAKIDKYKYKLGFKPSDRDFADEIRTYLRDGVAELMAQGKPEDEALRLTMEKFDVAELKSSFDDFMDEFNDFGVEEWKMSQQWYRENGESVGLFYAAFVLIGLVLGPLVGFLCGGGVAGFAPDRGWIYTLIGLGVGIIGGAALGLLSQAVIVTVKRK